MSLAAAALSLTRGRLDSAIRRSLQFALGDCRDKRAIVYFWGITCDGSN